MKKFITCPVCKKRLLTIAFKNHVINSAKGESFISLNNMMNFAKGKPYQFSPRVLISHDRHLQFYRKHLKGQEIKILVV
jgi:hypothetical protein